MFQRALNIAPINKSYSHFLRLSGRSVVLKEGFMLKIFLSGRVRSLHILCKTASLWQVGDTQKSGFISLKLFFLSSTTLQLQTVKMKNINHLFA